MNILKTGAAQVFFSIVIVSLNNTGKTSGPIKVEWKRSSEDGKVLLSSFFLLYFEIFGFFLLFILIFVQTKAKDAENGTVTWNEKIEFKSHLFKDHDDLAKKQIFFHVKEKDVCI